MYLKAKTVLFVHPNLIFLVSNFVVLIREAYGSGSWKMIRNLTDPDPQHWNREDEQREEEERNNGEE
jgi:hypothetical protein